MKFLIFMSCLLLSACSIGEVPDRGVEQKSLDEDELQRFNNLPETPVGEIPIDDDFLTAQFENKKFECRNVNQFTPKDDVAAARAFEQFVAYTKHSESDDNFFMGAGNRQRREALLTTALEAGSWKAAYVDAVWSARFPKKGETTADGLARVRGLAEKGIPIAIHKYASYIFVDRKASYFAHDAAIDRGSPHSMTSIASRILKRTKELRPLAKQLLECAVSQGHGAAYEPLGQIAESEGRRLDAYRLWAEGVNKGCLECVKNMRVLGLVRAGSFDRPVNEAAAWQRLALRSGDPGFLALAYEKDAEGEVKDKTPELTAVWNYYNKVGQFGETALEEFERKLPDDLLFTLNDIELLDLLRYEEQLLPLQDSLY
ncbi:hypothetical protein ACIPZG_06905 [Pseudomonas sp. NPDC089395]|uniref:hypothetical protein n=1 Tax=Pseudomonas sp. NPDC089395 TaxID=3364460 RepID=UPI003812A7C0